MSATLARPLIASLAAAATLLVAAPASHAQFGSFGGGQSPALDQAAVGPAAPAAPAVPAAPTAPTTPTKDIARTIDDDHPSGPYAPILQAVLDGTNAYRVANGAPEVRYSAALEKIATEWSRHQANVDVMSHNPDLRTLYPTGWSAFAENVLQNWDDATPQQLVQQWIDSPPHRAAMIDPKYQYIGLGYAVTGEHKVYATQNYAKF